MRKSLPKLKSEDKALSSGRSTLIAISLFVVIFVASYAFSGGFARLSGRPTITANLSVTDSALSEPNERLSISISNVSGNLSLSNVKMSITDSYGNSISTGFYKGNITLQITNPGVDSNTLEYIYHISATGGGNYLTNETTITITVSNGTPTPVTKIALIDALSGGTIGDWSP